MARLSISILSHQQRGDNSYPVSISVSHLGKTAYISTDKRAESGQVVIKRGKKSVLEIRDRHLLREVLEIVSFYEKELSRISVVGHTAQSLSRYLESRRELDKKDGVLIDFVAFCREYVVSIKGSQPGQASNFGTVVNSLVDFVGRPTLYTKEITVRFLEDFEKFLRSERIISRIDQFGKYRERKVSGLNDVSLYGRMKDFRTLFYLARKAYNNEDEGIITIPQNPFKKHLISQPLSKPRAKEVQDLILLSCAEYAVGTREELGRDMFFLSFFLMGTNAVDLYRLKKTDYKSGRIEYERKKTREKRKDKAFISIKVEDIAVPLIRKYLSRDNKSNNLFYFKEHYSSHKTFTRAINEGLLSLCSRTNLGCYTMYVARHSFASYARNECDIAKDIVSQMLNHATVDKTERTTDIYLKKDLSKIDRANKKVISSFLSQLSSFATTSLPG